MNQQQPDLFYSAPAYPLANPTRSPSLSRPAYNTTAGVPAASRIAGSRPVQGQPQIDAMASAMFPTDDRFVSYDGFRHQHQHQHQFPHQQQLQHQQQHQQQQQQQQSQQARIPMPPNQAYAPAAAAPGADPVFFGNTQAWVYNSGANTVNGAMGDGRMRSGARRAIPTEWTGMPDQAAMMGNQALANSSTHYSPPLGYNNQPPMGLMNGNADAGQYAPDRMGFQNVGMNMQPGAMGVGGGAMPVNGAGLYDTRQEPKPLSSDLIPTAIVIKNIPFNVRKETLTGMMAELGLPQPYAFNYHFDSGIFRGLAFANFQSPIDTQTVIEQLNGFDVQGRKLRVEYKKMLPEHERERIEREKREKRGQLEEQHQPITLHSQSSMQSINSTATRQRASPLRDLDLNNQDTLNFYTELTLFRSDVSRECLIFPSTITPSQRRTVHILAHNMGLQHMSVGEGQDRQIQVLKSRSNTAATSTLAASMHLPPGVSADAHRRGLSRAATIDFAETRAGAHSLYGTLGRQGRHGPTLELPDSPEGGFNALRGVKSFADLRSYTPSPASSLAGPFHSALPQGSNGLAHGPGVVQFGEYSANLGHTSALTTPTTPGTALSSNTVNTVATTTSTDTSLLISDLGGMSLSSEPFAGGNRLRPSRENPGAIGSQRPGINGTSTRPERQPLGPTSDWNDKTMGFAARTRTNGHVHHGSDSSDNGVRATSGSSATGF